MLTGQLVRDALKNNTFAALLRSKHVHLYDKRDRIQLVSSANFLVLPEKMFITAEDFPDNIKEYATGATVRRSTTEDKVNGFRGMQEVTKNIPPHTPIVVLLDNANTPTTIPLHQEKWRIHRPLSQLWGFDEAANFRLRKQPSS